MLALRIYEVLFLFAVSHSEYHFSHTCDSTGTFTCIITSEYEAEPGIHTEHSGLLEQLQATYLLQT